MLIEFLIKIGVAVLALIGVLLGSLGSYLMTSAYHPFRQAELWKNFLAVLRLAFTLRWKKAYTLLNDTVFFGDINPENRRLSLIGIYFLFVSFIFQTASAILAVIDVIISQQKHH